MAPAQVASSLEEAAVTQALTQGPEEVGTGGEREVGGLLLPTPSMAFPEPWGGQSWFSPFCK